MNLKTEVGNTRSAQQRNGVRRLRLFTCRKMLCHRISTGGRALKRPEGRAPVAGWFRGLLACVVILMGCAKLPAQPPSITTKRFPKPDRIRYDGHCFTIDGQDTFIRSAAFHYFRTPRELWRDRFQKIKDAGFNTVDTYVPWNWHERDMPDDGAG
jgi:hypothetical protein